MLIGRLKEKTRLRERDGTLRVVDINDHSGSGLDFANNDYLGLSRHPKVTNAQVKAIKLYGSGGRASELVSGHSKLHQQFCEEFSHFLGRPAAMLFSSGFAANTGVLNALLKTGDHVIHDRLNHASLLDGSQKSGVRFSRFVHNDVASLAKKLKNAGHALVAVEGVYSMDGDLAPLTEILKLTNHQTTYLDDAHALGVVGVNGRGSMSELNLSANQIDLQMNTLGKAFGSAGAVISGDKALIKALQNEARSYVFSTALPAHQVAASLAALNVLKDEPDHMVKLHRNIDYFTRCADQMSLRRAPSKTAIQPLFVEDPVAMARLLSRRHIFVGAIRPPTVPKGTSRLRICLSATHSRSDIDQLVEGLCNV